MSGGFFAGKKLKDAESRARTLVDSAALEADGRKKEIELQGKDLTIKLRQDFESETKQRREEILTAEKRIQQKEENLDKRVDLLERKEKDVNGRLAKLQEDEKSAQEKTKQLADLIQEEKQRLQKIASMSEEDAKHLLLSRLDQELVHEKAVRIRVMEDEIKDTVDKKSRPGHFDRHPKVRFGTYRRVNGHRRDAAQR